MAAIQSANKLTDRSCAAHLPLRSARHKKNIATTGTNTNPDNLHRIAMPQPTPSVWGSAAAPSTPTPARPPTSARAARASSTSSAVEANHTALSLFTEALTNKNMGLNAANAAASKARPSRCGYNSSASSHTSATVPAPSSSEKPRSKYTASVVPCHGKLSAAPWRSKFAFTGVPGTPACAKGL